MMKVLIPIGLVLALLLLPMPVTAPAKANFQPDFLAETLPGILTPAIVYYITPGKDITITGKVCVVSGEFTGGLAFEVYGPASDYGGTDCRLACFSCYDYETCGGNSCGNICISDNNVKCGDMPCPSGCGVDCDGSKGSANSGTFGPIQQGQCSSVYTLRVQTTEDWKTGKYVGILYTTDSAGNTLDIEWKRFEIKKTIVDVQIVTFLGIASIIGSAALVTKGLRLW